MCLLLLALPLALLPRPLTLLLLPPLPRFLCHPQLLFLPQLLLIPLRLLVALLLGEIRAEHHLVLPMPLWLIRRVVVPR